MLVLVCASLLTSTLKGPTLALVFSSFSASFSFSAFFAIATLSPSDYHVSSGRSRALRGGGRGGGGQQEQNRFPLLTFSFLSSLTRSLTSDSHERETPPPLCVCVCCDGACFDCCRRFFPLALFFTLLTGLVTDVRSLSVTLRHWS